LDPTQFDRSSKTGSLNGAKEYSRNLTEVDRIWSRTSLLGTKHGFIRMTPKVNNNLFGYFKITETNKSCSRSEVVNDFAAKQMIAYFFGYTGHVATVTLEDRKTVNTDWYTTIFCQKS